MKLYRHSEASNLFQIHELTEEELIDEYHININYMDYIKQLLTLSDKALLQAAPGTDAKVVRHNLKRQLETCKSYISLWNNTIQQNPEKQN